MLKIYLARHGQDSDNAARILNGHRDTSLTMIGREQARRLAEKIKAAGLVFDKIYTSPLQRVKQTAEIISKKLAVAEAEVMPELIERDFGIMTGRSLDEITALDKGSVVHTPEVDYFLSVDQAESFPQLLDRGRVVLEKVRAANSDANVLLLTSGDIAKMIYAAYHRQSWEEVLPRFYFSNTALILLDENLPLDQARVFHSDGILNQTILALSEKSDGNMKGEASNISAFLKSRNLDQKVFFLADLEHSNRVSVIDNIERKPTRKSDALISDLPGCLLAITVADCLPLFFYNSRQKIVALAHAGWRGIISKIAERVIMLGEKRYQARAEDWEVFIGPHIKSCHFEIKEDVIDKFDQSDLIARDGKIFIDLAKIVKKQLIARGVKEANIIISGDCSYCRDDRYFSYRRERGTGKMKTMLAYIGLK